MLKECPQKLQYDPSMKLVLLGVDVVLEEDVRLVVHLEMKMLADRL
jgi:hypothetical protein